MIGCNNCPALSIDENLSRGNKYLLIDTHFTKSGSINDINIQDLKSGTVHNLSSEVTGNADFYSLKTISVADENNAQH